MHKVSNMIVESRTLIKSSIGTLGFAGVSSLSRKMLMGDDSSDYEDLLSVPTFLRKQMDHEEPDSVERKEKLIKHSEVPNANRLDEFQDTKSLKDNMNTKSILDALEFAKYDVSLKYLNDWYVSHHRLPRKKLELTLAGFDIEIVQEFDEKQFRKEMLAFAIKLYIECDDHSALDESFVKYMENKYYTKDGIVAKVSSFIKQIF